MHLIREGPNKRAVVIYDQSSYWARLIWLEFVACRDRSCCSVVFDDGGQLLTLIIINGPPSPADSVAHLMGHIN